MNQDILISVIVPVYKVEEYLERCVRSIQNQTYRNLEILLVDDGSPDNCGAMCEAFAREDDRIRVIHKKNGGLSSARNAGIDVARGQYFGFVDSDDWIEPEMYETMLEAALRENVKLVCAGRYDASSKNGEKSVGLCPPATEVISGQELVRRIFTWENVDSAAWDKLYHRDLFREIRYPDGRVIEDVPVTWLMVLDAGRAAMVNKPFYNYFHRPGSITTASISERTFHFSEHAALVYDRVRKDWPELKEEARYLLVRSLIYNMMMLDIASPEDRKKFAHRHQQTRKAMGEHMGFLWTYPLFPVRQRILATMQTLGVYRGLRKVYRLFKTDKQ